MKQGRIIVITGSPGTGKTTAASIVAKESGMDKSVHMHTDDFFHYLSKGAIPPHLPESNEQNLVVIEAFLEAAKRYARGGYDVIVDGIVGPWFFGTMASPCPGRVRGPLHCFKGRQGRDDAAGRAARKAGQKNQYRTGGNHVGTILRPGAL